VGKADKPSRELRSYQVKSLQNIIAFSCWAEVVEQDQANEKGLLLNLEKHILAVFIPT
jgi:hypothetical protein